jgi:hypothetical protein
MTNDPAPSTSPTLRVAIAYARVSTPGQAAEEAILKQLAKIWKKAHEEGYTIADNIIEVQDGTLTLQDDRPELHRCLQAAKERDCVIITVSPSRISRNAEHAKQLDAAHPGRFVFVKRAKGYEDKTWSIEVDEKHARLPSTIANGTAVAMHSLQRKGLLRGAPDGGKAGRAASAKVRSAAAKGLAEQIADLLEEDPVLLKMKRPAFTSLLNAAGVKTTRGEAFTESRLTRPLRAAKAILATREAIARTSAPYGPLRGAGESPAANDDVPPDVTPTNGCFAFASSDLPDVVSLHPFRPAPTDSSNREDQTVSNAPECNLTEDELSEQQSRASSLWGRF